MHNEPRAHTENCILSALPPEEYERLAPHLEPVQLQHGQILYQADETIEHVYFPTNSMASLVSQEGEGEKGEVWLIGWEGMIGIPLVLGLDESPHDSMVQSPGGAMRMESSRLQAEFERSGALHDLLLRHTQSLLLQISQVAECNQRHTVEERLARWLLMAHDRCGCDELPLTQEFISMMLGCCGVTSAVMALQANGLISYTRRHITITDRQGLKEFSCQCYRIVKA